MAKGDEAMKGKVLEHEGRFFIEFQNELQEVDPMLVGGVEVLKKLAGQEVELVTLTKPWVAGVIWDKIRIVCYVPPPDILKPIFDDILTTPGEARFGLEMTHVHASGLRRRIRIPGPVCYLPADWVIRGVEDVVRRNLLERFKAENIITPEVYDQLIG